MASCQHQQQLRFRWNDHVPHLSKLLAVQRQEEQFCDITLVSEDGYVLKGHQAILSSTSGYFQRILKDVSSEQHPIVVLQGANHTELSCLLEYIYQGVTQVDHQFMESVIDVADMLEIKGLSQMKSSSSITKLIHTTDIQSPLHSPQCFHHSRSPSPHYLTSPPTVASPIVYSSISKMDSLQEPGGAGGIEAEEECGEGKGPCRVERVMRNRLGNIDYVVHPQSGNMTHTEAYSDQTSGIDLSISRGGCSSKAAMEESTLNDRMFKKRKLMEKVEEVNDPLTDPDWGRISEKKDDLLPPKHRKFNKSTAFDSSFSEIDTNEAGSSPPDSKRYITDIPYYNRGLNFSDCISTVVDPQECPKKCQYVGSSHNLDGRDLLKPVFFDDSPSYYSMRHRNLLKELQFDDDSLCDSPTHADEAKPFDVAPASGIGGMSQSTQEGEEVKGRLFEDDSYLSPESRKDAQQTSFQHVYSTFSSDEEVCKEPVWRSPVRVATSLNAIPITSEGKLKRDAFNYLSSLQESDQNEDLSIGPNRFSWHAENESASEMSSSGISKKRKLSEVAAFSSPQRPPSTSAYESDCESITSRSESRYKFTNFPRIESELPTCVALNLKYKKSLIASYELKDDLVRSAIKLERPLFQNEFPDPVPTSEQIKRPLNSFVLFMKDHVAKMKDGASNTAGSETPSPRILTLAGKAWKALSKEEKAPYEKKAKMLRIDHHKKYPHFTYDPFACSLKKQEDRQRKLMVKNLFRVHPLKK